MNEEEFFNRAINRICKDYDYNFANEFKLLFLKKDKEVERLNNIIKEVREKIENTTINCDGVAEDLIDDIYEIVDKEKV